jgi:hypothetical protein
MVDYAYSEVNRFYVNLAQVTDLLDCRVLNPNADDESKALANKNVKQLENAPMRLEKIDIRFPDLGDEQAVPTRDSILPLICPIFECTSTIDDPMELQNELEARIEENAVLGGRVTIADAMEVWDVIRGTDFHGATLDKLKVGFFNACILSEVI